MAVLYVVVWFSDCICVTTALVCNSIVVLPSVRYKPYDSGFNSPILDDLDTDCTGPFAVAHNLVNLWMACYSHNLDCYVKLPIQNTNNSILF